MSRSTGRRFLLDTYALLWWLAEPARLSPAAHAAIANPQAEVFVSTASAWEIATKMRLGKLASDSSLRKELPQLLLCQGVAPLLVILRHGLRAGSHPLPLPNPCDHLLTAQAALDGRILVSLDPALQAFACHLLW